MGLCALLFDNGCMGRLDGKGASVEPYRCVR